MVLPVHCGVVALIEFAEPMITVRVNGVVPLVLPTASCSPVGFDWNVSATVCGSDPRSLAHWIVYIRDMTDGHLGFISQSNLPVGQTLVLHCASEDGQTLRTECRIGRARQFMQGWNEGVLEM